MEHIPKNDFNTAISNTVLAEGLLIPMTNFVFAIKEKEPKAKNFSSFSEISNYEKESYKKIINYAKFLKQPLKLEMFVPCDEDENVLGEPEIYSQWVRENFNDELENEERINQCKDYHQAKEKVLFEHPLSSLDMIKDYIRAKNTLENFVNMQVSRGRIMKLNKNGMNAIFGTVA